MKWVNYAFKIIYKALQAKRKLLPRSAQLPDKCSLAGLKLALLSVVDQPHTYPPHHPAGDSSFIWSGVGIYH